MSEDEADSRERNSILIPLISSFRLACSIQTSTFGSVVFRTYHVNFNQSELNYHASGHKCIWDEGKDHISVVRSYMSFELPHAHGKFRRGSYWFKRGQMERIWPNGENLAKTRENPVRSTLIVAAELFRIRIPISH
jgi:hypothetical protein